MSKASKTLATGRLGGGGGGGGGDTNGTLSLIQLGVGQLQIGNQKTCRTILFTQLNTPTRDLHSWLVHWTMNFQVNTVA